MLFSLAVQEAEGAFAGGEVRAGKKLLHISVKHQAEGCLAAVSYTSTVSASASADALLLRFSPRQRSGSSSSLLCNGHASCTVQLIRFACAAIQCLWYQS